MRGLPIWVCALLAMATACISPSLSACADGRICPTGSICHEASSTCATPEQIAACDGASSGDCDVGGLPGECQSGVCVLYSCGDGLITAPEQCEPGNVGDTDCASLGFYVGTDVTCTSECTYNTTQCSEFCGDKSVSGPEECEPGIPDAGRDCTLFDTAFGYTIGLRSCSSLCSLRRDNCSHLGWKRTARLSDSVSFLGVQQTGDDQLVAVGTDGVLPQGLLATYESGVWTVLASVGTARLSGAIWAADSDDVWFGHDSGVFHWDGNALDDHPLPGGAEVLAISGVSSNAVFAVTIAGVLFRYDGSDWTPLADAGVGLVDVFARDADRAFVITKVGLGSWDNGTLTQTAAFEGEYLAVHGTGPDDVWLATFQDGDSFFHRFDGLEWTVGASSVTGRVLAMSGDDNAVVAAGAAGLVVRWDGRNWIELPIVDIPSDVVGIDERGGRLVAADGTQSPRRWDGPGWAAPADTPPTTNFSSAWMQDKNTWVAIGTDTDAAIAIHHDATASVQKTIAAGSIEAVWGAASDDVYAVGGNGTDIDHYDGAAWTRTTTGLLGGTLRGIHGTSATDVWVVGDMGAVGHFDGSSWTNAGPSTSSDLLDVYAASTTSVFIVGKGGALFQLADGQWNQWDLGTSEDITTVSGSGPADVWAVAGGPASYHHFDGIEWIEAPPPASMLSGVHLMALATDDVFAFGEGGLAAHFDGEGWSEMRFEAGVTSGRIGGIPGHVLVPINGEVRQFIWTRRWSCRQQETDCTDRIDDDCDGDVDSDDTDCM